MIPDKQVDENNVFVDRFLRAARTLERMVVQNIYSDIALGEDIHLVYNWRDKFEV